MDDQINNPPPQWYTWYAFNDLSGELSGARRQYLACERLDDALLHQWRVAEATRRGEPGVWLNDENEEAPDDSPVALSLKRILQAIKATAGTPENECDPLAVAERIQDRPR